MKSTKNKDISTSNTSSRHLISKGHTGGIFSQQEKTSTPFVKPRNSSNSYHSNHTNKLAAGLPTGQEEYVGGRTIGEFIGDVARPVGTALGNVVGSIAGALTGITISSNAVSGPTWSNHGAFDWQVGFSTTGRNGWLVQKIKNTYRAQNAAGAALGGATPTPEYWEAWAVDGTGNVTPNLGAVNDIWRRPNKGAGSQGHWSMTGKVYFTTTDPATQGLTPGGVPDAGILLSSTTAPGGLGVARLHRYAQGTWETTGTTPTHTGSAR
ncbi:hypothetical protein KORDIASMS9_03356 [Kordia sp. SMS9]|uniref:hypothetical protein n=1 Tax=Kordia sp. SMS9 TaxID=2282170 RepID=UPI000E0DC984|nr:hypothetical protein [Kordia sp. SMS9]AXG71101.1 hypothetical protein KORDIASMS9_03356 [Kordia sp. SMS9]